MLTILGWLWKPANGNTPQYTPYHVNVWCRMLNRNLTLPHRFVVATDTPDADFDPLITPIPLWNDWKNVKANWGDNKVNCYVRLKAFSAEARELIGERFVSIDLDLVVLGNHDSNKPAVSFLDPLFDRNEDFVMLRRFLGSGARPINWAQGSMWMMTAGARSLVWTNFKGQESASSTNGMIGTDQAWIAKTLPPTEAGWTHNDGVVCWNDLNSKYHNEEPPVKMIFFNCSPDQKPDVISKPIRARERAKVPWIARYYR